MDDTSTTPNSQVDPTPPAAAILAKLRTRPARRRLTVREEDDLAWFAAVGVDLTGRSALGPQLDAMRDGTRSTAFPSTEAGWKLDYGSHTDSARARQIACRLIEADRMHWTGTTDVLVRWASPLALGCEEMGGRRLIILAPLTAAARAESGRFGGRYLVTNEIPATVNRWHGGQRTEPKRVVGPGAALLAMSKSYVTARGPKRAAWAAILDECRLLLDLASAAYIAAAPPPRQRQEKRA